VRPQGLDRRFDRIGGVGVIDVDRRACAGDDRALEAAAHRMDARKVGQGRRDFAAGGDD
jgi:hypothetical protein